MPSSERNSFEIGSDAGHGAISPGVPNGAVRNAVYWDNVVLAPAETSVRTPLLLRKKSSFFGWVARSLLSVHCLFPPKRVLRFGRFYRPFSSANEALANDFRRIMNLTISAEAFGRIHPESHP